MENYKAQHAEVVPDAKDKNAMVQIEKCFATETLNKIHKKSVRGPNLRKKTTQLKPKKALKPRASGGAKRKRKKKATSIEELFADMGEKPKKKRKLNKKVPKREKRTLEQLLGMEDADVEDMDMDEKPKKKRKLTKKGASKKPIPKKSKPTKRKLSVPQKEEPRPKKRKTLANAEESSDDDLPLKQRIEAKSLLKKKDPPKGTLVDFVKKRNT